MLRAQLGFTLLELLVTLAILALILFMGVPYFIDYINNARLFSVGEEMRNGLHQARLFAIQRNASVAFTFNNTGWAVTTANPAGGAILTLASRSAEAREAKIAVVPTSATINFNGFGRTAPAVNLTIDLTLPSIGNCRANGGNVHCMRLTVTTGGQIKYCDPALPTTDARSC